MLPSLLSRAATAGLRLRRITDWLDAIDPGGRRRIRGLRLVAVFAVASMAGTLAMPGATSLDASACAASFAIWASVYEAAPTRRRAVAHLLALIAAAALGTAISAVWAGIVGADTTALSLLPLVGGAFLFDYAKRYGTLATGAGSMALIGQAVGFGLGLTGRDMPMIAGAALIAIVTAAVLRILAGASERDADALSRCRDFRRMLAARLRRYHDALHHEGDTALTRVIPKTAELSTAWAALDTLVRGEFTETDLIAGYLRTQIRRLYALMQTIRAIGDSLSELQPAMPGIRDRAAIGLVLHTLRSVVLRDAADRDPALLAQLGLRCDRLIQRAVGGHDLAIETRIALLRIGLETKHDASAELPPMPEATGPGGTAGGASARRGGLPPTTRVAIQAALSALAIIALNSVFHMDRVLWALVASTFVISSSIADTWARGLRRIVGTAVGVALGLGAALLFAQVPLVVWALAALAMVIYSVWLPLRYDVACGAYAFALVVTLAEAGDSSWNTATARGLDTVIGAAIGMVFSVLVLPVRLRDQLAEMLATLLTEVRDRVAASLGSVATGSAAPGAVTGPALLAEIEAQKTRFAGLRYEGILARDGDGGALLLLHIDALIDGTMRLVGEAHLVAGRVDPALCETVAGLDAPLRQAFDAVLDRLRRQDRRPLPPSDALLPGLRAYLATLGPDQQAAAGMLLTAALAYSSRKIIRTLTDLAEELDRRDGGGASALGGGTVAR